MFPTCQQTHFFLSLVYTAESLRVSRSCQNTLERRANEIRRTCCVDRKFQAKKLSCVNHERNDQLERCASTRRYSDGTLIQTMECSTRNGQAIAAADVLSVSEVDLQRIKQRGCGATKQDRSLMRLPDLKALTQPIPQSVPIEVSAGANNMFLGRQSVNAEGFVPPFVNAPQEEGQTPANYIQTVNTVSAGNSAVPGLEFSGTGEIAQLNKVMFGSPPVVYKQMAASIQGEPWSRRAHQSFSTIRKPHTAGQASWERMKWKAQERYSVVCMEQHRVGRLSCIDAVLLCEDFSTISSILKLRRMRTVRRLVARQLALPPETGARPTWCSLLCFSSSSRYLYACHFFEIQCARALYRHRSTTAARLQHSPRCMGCHFYSKWDSCGSNESD